MSYEHCERQGPGVALRTIFRSDKVQIMRWRCTAGQAGHTAVMRRAWHVISFTHFGTFILNAAGQSEVIDATRAMVIQPGEPFYMTRCNDSTAHGSAVAIHPDAYAAFVTQFDQAIARFAVPATVFLLQQLVVGIASLLSAASDVEETVLAIASRTLSTSSLEPRAPRLTPTSTIVDVQALLAANIGSPLPLEVIAETVNRSPYHLCRTFRRETGLRMHQYLQRLRIRASVGHVIDGKDLSSLAHNLGYSSHSHFGGAFRDELKVTPTQLRRIAALPRLDAIRAALSV